MALRFLAGIIVCALCAPCPGLGQESLPPIHRDEPAAYTYERRFSLDEALRGLEMVRSALASFRDLTAEAEKTMEPAKLKAIGNTDWETQNLGFRNMPLTIEGTLMKQAYLVKKLAFELAEARRPAGGAEGEAYLKAREEYMKAEAAFKEFWSRARIAD